DRLRFDLDFESGSRISGTLDTFIIGFHRTFGLSIGTRRQYENFPQRILLEPPDGGTTVNLDEHDPQPFQQSLLLSTTVTVTKGDDLMPAVDVTLLLRHKIDGGDVHGGAPVGVGGSLSLSKTAGPFCFYAGGSVAWFGESEFISIPLRPMQWSGLLGIEVRVF